MFLASGKWKPSSPLRPTSHTWKLGSRLFQGKMWSWHQFRFCPVPKIVDCFTLSLEWDASNVWNAGLNWRSWAKVDKIRNSMWSTIEPHYATGSWALKVWKYYWSCQMELQSCVATAVNAGPLQIVEVFLSKPKLDCPFRPRMKEVLRKLLRVCHR